MFCQRYRTFYECSTLLVCIVGLILIIALALGGHQQVAVLTTENLDVVIASFFRVNGRAGQCGGLLGLLRGDCCRLACDTFCQVG